MSIFIEYSCGCVGIPTEDGKAIIVKECDCDDRNKLIWDERDMSGTAFKRLDYFEDLDLATRIQDNLCSAGNWRTFEGLVYRSKDRK